MLTTSSLLVIGFICAFSILARLIISQVISVSAGDDKEKVAN